MASEVPMKTSDRDFNDDDYRYHETTYKGFVLGVALFSAHVAAVLVLMAIYLL